MILDNTTNIGAVKNSQLDDVNTSDLMVLIYQTLLKIEENTRK